MEAEERVKAEERFDVGYNKDPNVEKEIISWRDKTMKKATVVHQGSDGCLTVEFEDGNVKKYGYNDLGFWEEE